MAEKKPIWKSSVAQTLTAMVVGALLGLYFGKGMSEFKFIGDIWLNCLKMILVPMVFVTMALAVGSQSSLKTLGRVAFRILVFYLMTTAFAVMMGIGSALVLRPGVGMSLEGFASQAVKGSATFTLSAFFSGMFSNGMFKTFANANMLQTIVIAIMMGASIIPLKDEYKKSVIHGLDVCNEWIKVFLRFVIKMAPVGVLFLMADSFGRYGVVLLSSMFKLIGTFYVGVLAQIVLVYCVVLGLTAGVGPIKFIKDSSQVWAFTIATCSSVANIPNSIDCADRKFGVPRYISNFCIPLGAQINFDGSAILYGCLMIFLAQMRGTMYAPLELLQIVIVATLVSSAGGGIPGSSLVKMMVVIETFGMPVEIVGIIAGFYRLFDMGTTTCNCLGDLAGTVAVTKWEQRRAKRLGVAMEGEDEMHI